MGAGGNWRMPGAGRVAAVALVLAAGTLAGSALFSSLTASAQEPPPGTLTPPAQVTPASTATPAEPPPPMQVTPASTPTPAAPPTDKGIGDKFTDPDGDTLTYAASVTHPGELMASITGEDSDTLSVVARNPASSTVIYGAYDGYGGYASRTLTVTGTAAESRSVVENSVAGTEVGAPVTGRPYDGETLICTLTGEAATAFVIDPATGQISVAEGAVLDYETKDSYSGQVRYTVQGQAAVISVTIDARAGSLTAGSDGRLSS